jgi:Flp pilus assembly pilin Flp
MEKLILEFVREDSGLTVVEYVVASGLIAAVLGGLFTSLGEDMTQALSDLIE